MISLFGHGTQIALRAIDFVYYAWLLAVRIFSLFGTRKKAVDRFLWFVSDFDLSLFKKRPIFSETPCTYGNTTKPLRLSSAGCLVNALSQFGQTWDNCYLAERLLLVVSSRLPLFVDWMLFAFFSKVLTTDLLWQRVTGREIEITIGVCQFSVNIHMNLCAVSTCDGF